MSTSAPLVSVIIPCYNYATYIPETLESLIAQTYANWEAIVVDDGSKDDSAAVVKRYTDLDFRIRYHHQTNGGLSAARNAGLRLAQGKYLQLLDADDFIAPTKLAYQVASLEADPSITLVYGDTYNFQHVPVAADRVFRQFFLTRPPISAQGPALALHMADDNIFLVSCPLFRRDMAEAVGEFNQELFSLEDWNFWYRAALLNLKFVYDNQPGTAFYVRTHTTNMSGNRFKMWKYKIEARRDIIAHIRGLMNADSTQAAALQSVLVRNTNLLHEEQARFELLFGQLHSGLGAALRCIASGHKPMKMIYDSAYWIKERLMGRNKIK